MGTCSILTTNSKGKTKHGKFILQIDDEEKVIFDPTNGDFTLHVVNEEVENEEPQEEIEITLQTIFI